MPVLLCAEADKIQDIVFRSSSLRMVVGASQLLTRFCEEIHGVLVNQLGLDNAKALVHDSGSFLIKLPDESAAHQYGRLLAEAYHATMGGTLTVAEPTPYRGQAHFAEDVELARDALALAKAAGHARSAVAQGPFTAYCQSCGIELASVHKCLQPKLDERKTYICPTCQRKDDERDDAKAILGDVRKATHNILQDNEIRLCYPESAEDLPIRDARGLGYVAYLAADGNGMGQLFSSCPNRDKLQSLSEAVPCLLKQVLGQVAADLIGPGDRRRTTDMPLLPMILGGDDLLALIPAPFAWDAAQRFCRYYEKLLGQKVKELDLDARPTVSAVVVICKADYPYRLAHKEAERALKEVKSAVRLAEQQDQYVSSALGFVALKGQARDAAAPSGDYRATAMPYWLNPAVPADTGGYLLAQSLLEHRLALKNVPTNQLAAVEALFYPPSALPTNAPDIARWRAPLDARIERIGSQELRAAVDALDWHAHRSSAGTWWGHGLPDLLQLWDYTYDLKKDLRDYAPEEA